MDIYRFYSNYGWKEKNNLSKDAELFEDLRKCAAKYVSQCRYRVNNHIPNKGYHLLDFASGPIQYKEYISYSKNFVQIEVLANLISWITPFVISVIILSILNRIFIYPLVLKYSNLFDHILGAFFGLVRGVILLCLVFIFIIYLIEDIDKLPLTLNDTYSVKIGYSFSKLILPILPVEKLDYFEKDFLL